MKLPLKTKMQYDYQIDIRLLVLEIVDDISIIQMYNNNHINLSITQLVNTLYVCPLCIKLKMI